MRKERARIFVKSVKKRVREKMKKFIAHITLLNIIKVILIAGLYALAYHWRDGMSLIPMGIGTLLLVETKW